MASLIKMVLDEQLSHLKFDKHLIEKILKYDRNFITKNEEHITFFGSALFGVNIVRFENKDRLKWYNEIIGKDERILQAQLYNLRDPEDPREPLINTDFKIISDVMNISFGYLVYRFLNEKSLDKKLVESVTISLVRILNYKFLTSLIAHYFKYPADTQVAEALFNDMSLKFELKKEGSWFKYIDLRANKILDPKSIHYQTLSKMTEDAKIFYFLSDSQGSIRGTVKSLYARFIELNRSGVKIVSSSSTYNFDGNSILKDRTNAYSNEIRYLLDISHDKNDLIKPELLKITLDLFNNMSSSLLHKTLVYISNESFKHEEVLRNLVIFSFNALKKNANQLKTSTDIGLFLYKLKGYYTASRGVDDLLGNLRTNIEKIIIDSGTSKNSTVVKNIRTAVMVYLMARVMAKNAYT